jgi:hypothetical protein
MISSGSDRLPKNTKRKVTQDVAARSKVEVQGTWLKEDVYKLRFLNPRDRKHKWDYIKSPETGKLVKAYFVPDAESWVWRGSHGFIGEVRDERQVAADDDQVEDGSDDRVDRFATSRMSTVAAPKVTGKTLAQIANEEAHIARCFSFDSAFCLWDLVRG